jgi:hypothetical protein
MRLLQPMTDEAMRVEIDGATPYSLGMVMEFFQDPGRAPRRETPAEREARIQREREIIAAGHAQIESGNCIDDDDALEAWLDELDRDEDAPPPLPSAPLGTRF